MLNTFNIILTNVNRLNNVRTKVLYNILYHFDNVFDSLPHPEHHHPHHVPVPEPPLAASPATGLVKLAGGREELDPVSFTSFRRVEFLSVRTSQFHSP